MPRAKYSQKQADEMLTRGRVFLLRVSERPEPTKAYAIVTGREDGVVDYSFLDAPGANQTGVAGLYPRIIEIGEVRTDYLKQIEAGKKVEVPIPALSVEWPEASLEHVLHTDISRFSGDRAEIYRRRRKKCLPERAEK